MKNVFILTLLISASFAFGQRKIIVPAVNDKKSLEKTVKKSGEFSVENISQIKKDSVNADSVKKTILVKEKPVVRKKNKISKRNKP